MDSLERQRAGDSQPAARGLWKAHKGVSQAACSCRGVLAAYREGMRWLEVK